MFIKRTCQQCGVRKDITGSRKIKGKLMCADCVIDAGDNHLRQMKADLLLEINKGAANAKEKT